MRFRVAVTSDFSLSSFAMRASSFGRSRSPGGGGAPQGRRSFFCEGGCEGGGGGAYAFLGGAFLGLWAFRRARSALARSAGVLWNVNGAAAPLESGTARLVAIFAGSSLTGAGRDTTGAPRADWSACATLG